MSFEWITKVIVLGIMIVYVIYIIKMVLKENE